MYKKKIVQHEVAAANHFYAYKSKQSLSNYFICKINWEKHPHQAVACFLIITYCIHLMLHPISQESSWSIKVKLRLNYINSNCSIRLMLQALFFHDPVTSSWSSAINYKKFVQQQDMAEYRYVFINCSIKLVLPFLIETESSIEH